MECYNSILTIDKLETYCQYADASLVGLLAMTNYEMRYEMRRGQGSSLLPNSAAIPLPTLPNSAAGGDAPLVDKRLKEQVFSETRRPFAGTEARFVPALRETWRNEPLSDPARMR